MKRQSSGTGGIFCCLFMNLVLNSEWGAAGILLWICSRWWTPLKYFGWGALAFWILRTLFLTLLVDWGNRSAKVRDPEKPNKNPYSSTTESVFRKAEEDRKAKNQKENRNP